MRGCVHLWFVCISHEGTHAGSCFVLFVGTSVVACASTAPGLHYAGASLPHRPIWGQSHLHTLWREGLAQTQRQAPSWGSPSRASSERKAMSKHTGLLACPPAFANRRLHSCAGPVSGRLGIDAALSPIPDPPPNMCAPRPHARLARRLHTCAGPCRWPAGVSC